MSLAGRLAAVGMAADDAASRAAHVERVRAAFGTAAGEPPAWSWFVPGRLEVFGKHKKINPNAPGPRRLVPRKVRG